MASVMIAAGQHVVADCDFLCDEMLADAVVDAFVMAAEDNQVFRQRQRVCHPLVELLAVGCHKNHLIVVAFRLQRGDATVHRLYLHNHTCLAAKRIVVDVAMLVKTVFAEIVHHDFRQSLVLSPFQNRAVQRRLKHFRQNCYYINAHYGAKVVTLRLIAKKISPRRNYQQFIAQHKHFFVLHNI